MRRVVWELAADEQAAVWREQELIFALRPPFNTSADATAHDPVRIEARVPFIVVTDAGHDELRFTLEHAVPPGSRAYGCFPHLGKGMGSRLGIACSDGYTALLRLLWAASPRGTTMPAVLNRSAPTSFTVTVDPILSAGLHGFLSGSRARLPTELYGAAEHRPEFMQPALRRDTGAAALFFAAGPRLVHDRRRRHGIRTKIVDGDTYRRLVRAEIEPVLSVPAGT